MGVVMHLLWRAMWLIMSSHVLCQQNATSEGSVVPSSEREKDFGGTSLTQLDFGAVFGRLGCI